MKLYFKKSEMDNSMLEIFTKDDREVCTLWAISHSDLLFDLGSEYNEGTVLYRIMAGETICLNLREDSGE